MKSLRSSNCLCYLAAGASLPLTREVDFCAAKRRRERENIARFGCCKNSVSPSVSLSLDSSLVRGSRMGFLQRGHSPCHSERSEESFCRKRRQGTRANTEIYIRQKPPTQRMSLCRGFSLSIERYQLNLPFLSQASTTLQSLVSVVIKPNNFFLNVPVPIA